MYYIFNNTHYTGYINAVNNIGYSLNFLDFIFFLSILLTILVIISKNPIVSVLYLIGLFFNIACYLILLGINFIGLSYLLVYVGAVSILFLFILMLINVRISELVTETTNSIPLVISISMLFTYSIKQILNSEIYNIYDLNIMAKYIYKLYTNYIDIHSYAYNNINDTLYVTSNTWDGYLSATNNIVSIGNIIYTNYSLWLIITSIILLLAMVGSIVITLKKI